MVRIQIEVFSDTLCPWCYIGKKYLDNAMDLFRGQHPDAVFDVVWRPFYLYPNLEKTGQPKSKLLEPIRQELQDRIAQAGAQAGINFRLSAGMTGSSSASHALLRLASRYTVASTLSPSSQTQPLAAGFSSQPPDATHSTSGPVLNPYPSPQSRLLDSLFAAHFEHGQDISSPTLLMNLAREAGLPLSEANRALLDLRDTDADAAHSGTVVKGVPTLTVQGRWRVGGMQEVDVLMGVFERALREASRPEQQEQQQEQRAESVETVEGSDGVPVRPRRGMWLKDILIDDSAQ